MSPPLTVTETQNMCQTWEILPLSGVFENSVSVDASEIENSRFYLRKERSKRNEQIE